MGILHHPGGRQRHPVAFVDQPVVVQVHRLAIGPDREPRRDEVGLPWADAVRIGADLGQTLRREQVLIGTAILGQGEVVGLPQRQRLIHRAVRVLAGAVNELHQPHLGARAQRLQVAHLEGLDDDRGVLLGVTVAGQCSQQLVLDGQAQRAMVGAVLDLGIDADGAPGATALVAGQLQHFLEGGHLVLAVVALIPFFQGLHGAQRAQLGQREVADEPALFLDAIDRALALAAGELGMVLHVGGGRDVGLMSHHQHAILGGNQVWLDEVGPAVNGPLIARQRVVRQVAGCTAMPQHQRLLSIQRRIASGGCRRPPNTGQRTGAGHGHTRLGCAFFGSTLRRFSRRLTSSRRPRRHGPGLAGTATCRLVVHLVAAAAGTTGQRQHGGYRNRHDPWAKNA